MQSSVKKSLIDIVAIACVESPFLRNTLVNNGNIPENSSKTMVENSVLRLANEDKLNYIWQRLV